MAKTTTTISTVHRCLDAQILANRINQLKAKKTALVRILRPASYTLQLHKHLVWFVSTALRRYRCHQENKSHRSSCLSDPRNVMPNTTSAIEASDGLPHAFMIAFNWSPNRFAKLAAS
ncbi:unnamed protein product [Polarella glacialis]|uniref:Uncharacterized protein n=1 Tax=Polarella glacialis TaxID=89957 RepID=A0A813DKZ1_POLGL|nr:unnamed protein product [Polarella glacialis]